MYMKSVLTAIEVMVEKIGCQLRCLWEAELGLGKPDVGRVPGEKRSEECRDREVWIAARS